MTKCDFSLYLFIDRNYEPKIDLICYDDEDDSVLIKNKDEMIPA